VLFEQTGVKGKELMAQDVLRGVPKNPTEPVNNKQTGVQKAVIVVDETLERETTPLVVAVDDGARN
jgi:hypothetical protein